MMLDVLNLLQLPLFELVIKLANLLGVGLTAFPPIRTGTAHFESLSWESNEADNEVAVANKMREVAANYIKKIAQDFSPLDFKIMFAGVLLIGLAALHGSIVAALVFLTT